MPTNPQQPRDRDGRFGNLPPQVPTSAPAIPSDANPWQDPEYVRIQEAAQAIASLESRFRAGSSAAPEDDQDWARTYHVRFRNFHRQTLAATKELFRARPSQLSPEERHIVFKNWVDQISDTYGMERPTFIWDESADMGGGGFYRRSDHSITMSPNHPSIITLIHETRHALQAKEKGAAMISDDVEIDARAWSLSLYYKVRPNLLKRLVREGRVFHIDRTVFDEN